MTELFSTKGVAKFLDVNEKMIYALISEKGLPATKVTGKWLFPRHLVEQWIEANTINYPKSAEQLPSYDGILILTGSNDPLLDKTLSLFNAKHDGHIAVFGNLGSLGGLKALRNNRCHIATSHLLQENEEDYNFDFASDELDAMPAMVNFCKREQGILVARGNPKKIESVGDLAKPGIQMVNRSPSTGTRHLIDREFQKAGICGDQISGYGNEVNRHIDVGMEILGGRADAGPGIKAAAVLLNLDFVSLRWERYDLLISKDRFFDEGVQLFLGMLTDPDFRALADDNAGYDLSLAGKMVYPNRMPERGEK